MNAVSSPLQTNQNRQAIEQLRTYMEKSIVGQRNFVESLMIGLLADGHLLLEGAPGLA